MVSVQELISMVLVEGGCLVGAGDLSVEELMLAEERGVAARLVSGAWLVWVPDERAPAVLGRVPKETGGKGKQSRGLTPPPAPPRPRSGKLDAPTKPRTASTARGPVEKKAMKARVR